MAHAAPVLGPGFHSAVEANKKLAITGTEEANPKINQTTTFLLGQAT